MKYTVKRGDTLSEIARKYNTTVEALVASNGIKDKNKIKVGQVLNIPEPVNYEKIGMALENCLEAIEKLPEFETLCKALEGD